MKNLKLKRRKGSILIYSVLTMTVLVGFASFAVDVGRLQMVKTDLRRSADATARGTLAIYAAYGLSTAQFYGPQLPTSTNNPVDYTVATNGTYRETMAPTVTMTWGKWDAQTKTFTTGNYTPPAIKVTVSRTAANNNAVPIIWGSLFNRRSCDVSATAIATVVAAATVTVTVPATGDPWLAGMPSGSTASYDDTTTNAAAFQATGIPIVPGSYMTFNNISGSVKHGPTLASDPAEGSTMYSHGADSPGGPTPAAENGIADVLTPIDGLLGVFLDNNAPNTTAAPSRRDYSSAASRDTPSYDDIQLKQPFFIGDGQTSSSVTQQFRVPDNATRLYLGIMDGYEWNNNVGSFSVTLTTPASIMLVQ